MQYWYLISKICQYYSRWVEQSRVPPKNLKTLTLRSFFASSIRKMYSNMPVKKNLRIVSSFHVLQVEIFIGKVHQFPNKNIRSMASYKFPIPMICGKIDPKLTFLAHQQIFFWLHHCTHVDNHYCLLFT